MNHLKQESSKVFDQYAKYYDLLNQEKDYNKEIDFIDKLIVQHYQGRPNKVLDIGCGTGIHALNLAKKDYSVTGIDLSSEMISIANNHKVENCEFQIGDARSFSLKNRYDIILSLFHVVSYQLSNEDINEMFANVSRHLAENALFIFDFWYTPAVLTERPSVRVKRYEDDEIKMIRIAEPEDFSLENRVDVSYEILIQNKNNLKTHFVHETHKMRHYSIYEIKNILDSANMELMNYGEWLTGLEPSEHTWGVYCVGRKKGSKR
jgi:ubiquinone/menaquinone biosynthesis C-methylase UbiE